MTVDLKLGFALHRAEGRIKRHPEPRAAGRFARPGSTSRKGKVSITQWVDPVVRKQLQRLAVDHDKEQH